MQVSHGAIQSGGIGFYFERASTYRADSCGWDAQNSRLSKDFDSIDGGDRYDDARLGFTEEESVHARDEVRRPR